MSHIGTSQRGEGGDDRGHRITSTTNPTRITHEAKVTTPKQSEIIQANACHQNQQANHSLHHHHHHHHYQQQQQQQHLPLPNPQECSSNQSGSDSGLGYTNSISSENSSLIVNTTSLEKINAYQNNGTSTNSDNGVIKFISNDKSRKIQITESDSFNVEPLNKAGQNNDGATSCNETIGKIDAATTCNIPNKAATTNNDLSGNAHRIDAQHSRANDKQLAKSVKVIESINNNVKPNQGNNLLSASLPMSRTQDELGAQEESFSDINEESLANNAKVINNTDDGAKIKHSIRQGANQVAISTVRPREYDDGLDKSAEVSIKDREIQVPCAHLSGANQLSSVVNPIDSSPSNIVPFIKSSLKKTTGDRTVDAPKKTKHNRNVSFNQTVIVFCEEIDTSSPSETFEPPLDYQDAPPSMGEHQSFPGNIRGALTRDFKSQNAHVSDDFDILSKIVGDDASSLTDDQLFGLLENGSLLKSFDLGESNKAFTIDRLNSDQGYLCHDAISDSESESSLTIDTHYKEVSTVNNNKSPNSSSVKSKESTLDQLEANRSTNSQYNSKSDHENLAVYNNLQSVDCYPESQIDPVQSVQQRSMPARVKVSTVDNSMKRQQKLARAQVNETDSALHSVRSACPKVIQSNRQSTTKSEPMLIRLTNVEPAIISKAQMRDNSSDVNARRQPTRDQEEQHNLGSKTMSVKPYSTSNSVMMSDDQISSRDSRHTINDQYEQFRDSSSSQNKVSHTPPEQPANVNAQVIQSNQACHICRAIESNLHQTNNFCTRVERTGLMTNNISTHHTDRAKTDQPQLQRSAHPHQYHPSGSATIESQHQKQLQPVLTSQSSCVPCRESSINQQNCVTQPARPNLANNLTDHQQARPIACQLVYVVDQCGNRMKALQVVGAARMGLNSNQSMRPIMIAPNNCRMPAPSTGQNFIRMSNPTGQIVGIVTNGPVQTSTNIPRPSNQNVQLPVKEIGPAMNQQTRMQIVSHSAPRNHTVYYVRQPLGSQDFRQSSDSVVTNMARSFPDVHEIRRLDGIRAPTESPNLMQPMNNASTLPGQLGNKLVVQHHVKNENRSLKLRRDDSDDPTFGFSRRPAVKVVTNSVREFQTQSVVKANQNLNQAIRLNNNDPRLLAGSQTLDRKSVHRDHSSQREVKENIPSTSSMSNINKTLTDYADPTSQARYENAAKSKETNVGQFIDRNDYTMQTSHQTDNFVYPRRDRMDQDGTEVAYVMNL